MPVRAACPQCKKSYEVTEQLAGKQIRCLSCNLLFQLPRLDSTPSPIQKPAAPPSPKAAPTSPSRQPANSPRPKPVRQVRDEDEESPPPRPRPRRRPVPQESSFPVLLVVLLVVGVLTVGGGAVAAFFLFGGSGNNSSTEVAQQEQNPKGKDNDTNNKVQNNAKDTKTKDKDTKTKDKVADTKTKSKDNIADTKIKDTVEKPIDKVKDTVEKPIDKVKDTVEKPIDKVKDTVEKPIDKDKDKLKVKDTVEKPIDKDKVKVPPVEVVKDPDGSKEQLPTAITADMVKKVKKATVHLRVEMADGKSAEGSGFFALEPGIVLTNAHVVGMMTATSDKPRKIEVTIHSGQKGEFKISASVLGVDPTSDLAVLRVQEEEARWPAALSVETDLSKLTETQKVYIFGFPLGVKLGKEISVSESSIASLRNESDGTLNQIQTNGGMHPGNSGGPVIDTRGQVIGVAVAGIRGTTINFAVPSEKVHSMLQGRVQDLKTGETFRDGPAIKVPVQVAFLDPLQRIRQVTLETWTGQAGPNRAAMSKAPAPVAGDSPRTTVNVTYQQGIVKHDLVLLNLDPGKVQWVQAVFTTKTGMQRWGPATALKISTTQPLERVPAKLIVNAESQLRTMNLISKFSRQISDGKKKVVESDIMEMQILETLEKKGESQGVKLSLGQGQFYFLDNGRKAGRHAPAQASVRGSTFDFKADLGGRLTGFGFTNYNFKNIQQREEANDMAADVVTTYQASCLGMPNREVQPQETWKENIRMLVGQGKMKDVFDLVLTCTYLGSRTANGKTEAVIGLSGNIKLIKSPRPVKQDPNDKLSGTVVFNVTDGMISKYQLTVSAEFSAALEGGGQLTMMRLIEIDYTRVPGDLYNLKSGAPKVLAKGNVLINLKGTLTAKSPLNPYRKGARQRVFPVNLTAGNTYVIDMKHSPGSNLDPYLRLEDNTGQILKEDDDSGGNLDARIVYKATQTGPHRVVATTFQPNQIGAFQLTIVEFGEARKDPPLKEKAEPIKEPQGPAVTPVAGAEELRGNPNKLPNLTTTAIKLNAKELMPTLCWGDPAGSLLFTVDQKAILRRVSVPSFQATHKLDLERKCTSLALSSMGLVVGLPDVQEVWLLDVGSLRVLKKISVPGLRQVTAAPESARAVAGLTNGLTVLDLQAGTLSKATVKQGGFVGFDNPVMTPNGRYVFTRGGLEQLHRFAFVNEELVFEEASPRIAQGAIRVGIQVSPDSKYVCLPTGGGNYKVGGTHPEIASYSTYIYPTDNLKKPAFAIHQGAYPQAVGFDPVSRKVYSQNFKVPLIVFGPTGIKQEEYKLPGSANNVRQYLVHPGGNRLLLLSDNALLWVELPALKQ